MRIATFNVQNLRLRLRDGRPHLDGAMDADTPWMSTVSSDDPSLLDILDRQKTAEVIRDLAADVVVLQEVFDRATLDFFHDRFLAPSGVPDYPHRICLPGNDGRGLNLAVLSRLSPKAVISHAAATAEDLGLDDLAPDLQHGPIFRRDCLEIDLGAITLFACHFKAPYPDEDRAWRVRNAEARAVRRLVERRFQNPSSALWLILGDLNEPADPVAQASALNPLTRDLAISLMDRIPNDSDWTFQQPDTGAVSRPDRLLASPALAARFPAAVPEIFRAGLTPASLRGGEGEAAAPGTRRPHASDHAAVAVEFPGL